MGALEDDVKAWHERINALENQWVEKSRHFLSLPVGAERAAAKADSDETWNRLMRANAGEGLVIPKPYSIVFQSDRARLQYATVEE